MDRRTDKITEIFNLLRNSLTYDVSVITLASALELNEYVQPLRLPPRSHISSGKCINTGWGNAHPTGGIPIIIPDALQAVELEIVPYETCSSIYESLLPLDSTMMCAGADQWKGACMFNTIASYGMVCQLCSCVFLMVL